MNNLIGKFVALLVLFFLMSNLSAGNNFNSTIFDSSKSKYLNLNNGKQDDEVTDTTRIKLGRREVVIIETEGEKSVRVVELEEKREREIKRRTSDFEGHWSGIEIGLNNNLTPDQSLTLPEEYSYMEIYSGRSRNWNFNFYKYDMGLVRDQFGLVTGLGLEINNYRFRNENTITVEDGVVRPRYFEQTLDRARLRTYHVTVPLLMEVQFPSYESRHRRVHLSAGVIGGLRIGSNARVVYGGDAKGRERVRDDFYLSPFRYGLTARVGVRSVNLYANYYMSPLFQNDKGPEIYPMAIGFSFSF